MCAGLGLGVGGCGQVLADMDKGGQRWAKVGRSGWVRLIGLGLVTWEVRGCGYACRSRGGCRWMWVGALFSNTRHLPQKYLIEI